MLTKADDYPIHQLPQPVAVAGSDHYFHGRYFCNAQAPDGNPCITDARQPGNAHIRARVQAQSRRPDSSVHASRGIREQLFGGPHEPFGFHDAFDLA